MLLPFLDVPHDTDLHLPGAPEAWCCLARYAAAASPTDTEELRAGLEDFSNTQALFPIYCPPPCPPLSFFTRLALRSPLLGVPFECGPIHLDGRPRRRSSRELEERFGRTLSPELFQHLQHLLVALLGG